MSLSRWEKTYFPLMLSCNQDLYYYDEPEWSDNYNSEKDDVNDQENIDNYE